MNEIDLETLLREHTSGNLVPGAAIGVLQNGGVTTAYAGVTPETLFAVGSLTKSLVATAYARLADQCRLALDDSVSTHVPELRETEWAQRASLRDLLANRSRIPLSEELEFSDFPGEDDEVLSRFAARLAARKPEPPFWSYTNAGWSVLGRALESVTGLTWEDAMRAEVFAPLELDQTTFVSAPVTAPRTVGYRVEDGVVVPAPVWAPRAFGPAGSGVLSTLTDLLRFARAHLEDPSLAVLRVTHEEIRIHAWLDAWCLGWARFDWDGGPVWGWDGVLGGYRAFLRLVPDRGGAIVLLTNCATARAMYRPLFGSIMEESFGVRVPPLRLEPRDRVAGDLGRFAGVYAWSDRRTDVAATASSLVLDGGGRQVQALPIDERTFVVDKDDPDWPTLMFDGFDEDGRPSVLYDSLWGMARR